MYNIVNYLVSACLHIFDVNEKHGQTWVNITEKGKWVKANSNQIYN